MMLSTELFVLSQMVGSASSLFLVSWSAKVVGIDVKRDTTSNDTIISWVGGGVTKRMFRYDPLPALSTVLLNKCLNI